MRYGLFCAKSFLAELQVGWRWNFIFCLNVVGIFNIECLSRARFGTFCWPEVNLD
jgi:hypothetical protein